MEKIYKILGKRGRITIPYELRLKHGFAYNDVVSFEETDKDTIKWEKFMSVVFSFSLDDITFINFSLRRYLKKHPNADANKFTRRRYNRYFKRLVKPILKEYKI